MFCSMLGTVLYILASGTHSSDKACYKSICEGKYGNTRQTSIWGFCFVFIDHQKKDNQILSLPKLQPAAEKIQPIQVSWSSSGLSLQSVLKNLSCPKFMWLLLIKLKNGKVHIKLQVMCFP